MTSDKAKAIEQKISKVKTGKDTRLEVATGTAVAPVQLARVRQVAETLWLPDSLTKEERGARIHAAIATLEGVGPRDEVEGMLAVQLVATHNAAIEYLRRATISGRTPERVDRDLKTAQKLLTLYTRQLDALDKHRGKGQQRVTVEHVHVEAGGQAIVGQVETERRKGRRNGSEALNEAAPEAPLETSAREAKSNTRNKC